VYAGTDPLTGREIRFRKTCKTERDAQIELGKLLALAGDGRQPDCDVTLAQLLDQYTQTAGRDLSTRESNLGYIRRTIKPAVGSMQVRKVPPSAGHVLRPPDAMREPGVHRQAFIEHRTVPEPGPDPGDPGPDGSRPRIVRGRRSAQGNWPQVTPCRRWPASPGSEG
jgi:hypothetical protein